MCELLNDIKSLVETGDLPDNNDFLISKVMFLIVNSENIKFKKLIEIKGIPGVKEVVKELDYSGLLQLKDTLEGYKQISFNKLALIFKLK